MVDNKTKAAVSVVIPCYRCTETIDRALKSVHAQTWLPAEVFLVDDCSDDGTLDHLHALANEYPRGWVQIIGLTENGGPGTARNVGWDSATQPLIAFLDADDSWHPQKIEIQAQWMLAHPEVALTGHRVHQLQAGDEPVARAKYDAKSTQFVAVTRQALLWSNVFPTRSVMLKRDLIVRFSPKKYHSEDYLLWLMIAYGGADMARCDLPLAFLHKASYGEGGLSAQLWKMELGELDVYHRLQRDGYIGFWVHKILCLWSWLRYMRRLLIVKIRR